MPLFDFRCKGCGREFETLVRPTDAEPPKCQACGGSDLEKLLPTFAVSSEEQRRAAADKQVKRARAIGRQEAAAAHREAEEHLREDH